MSAVHAIVAGVEHLVADDPALVAAAALARWSGASLHLVHSYELPSLHSLPRRGAFASHGEELRGKLAAAAGALPEAKGAVCHAVHGHPATSLLQAAGDFAADLVVVGAGGRHTLLGGTAERVLRSATVPVLVVRRPILRSPARLLLATDLSELSAAAHERGLDLAEALFEGAPEIRSALVVGPGTLPAPLPEAALARAARAELRSFLRARRCRPARIEPVVRTGSPAEEIIAEAKAWNAELLVLGTHGRVLLGSVAEAVVRHAPCNVLAVPPGPGTRADGETNLAESAETWAATLAPART